MNDIMSGHEEIRELLGVYALDALRTDEHEAVTRHLAGCAECQAEVADHLEVAADLSAITTAAPPPGLWDRIAGELDPAPGDDGGTRAAPTLRVVPPVATSSPPAATARRPLWITAASIASVAAAIVVVLAVGWLRASQRANDAEAVLAKPAIEVAADQALNDPRNRRLDLRTPTGDVTAIAVVTPTGEGYFVPRGMQVLPDDRTYQLWQIGPAGPVSLGVFGNEPGVRGFHLQGAVQTLAVTNETAGGRALPEGTPLASGTA
jgi:anti-sigma-K factor RskA